MSREQYYDGLQLILIKRFLISTNVFLPAPDDDTAEYSTSHSHGLTRVEEGDARSGGRGKRKLTKEERKAQRGANKGRKFGKVRDELNLCWKVAAGNICEFGSEYVDGDLLYQMLLLNAPRCRFIHDIPKYLAAKPADIRIRETNEIADTIPFVTEVQPETNGHLNTRCPIFDETGECR